MSFSVSLVTSVPTKGSMASCSREKDLIIAETIENTQKMKIVENTSEYL